jgi:hypothetical protein
MRLGFLGNGFFYIVPGYRIRLARPEVAVNLLESVYK